MSIPSSADANLLLGVLALQLDLISRDQLVAGLQAWVNEKGTPLAEHLVRNGALKTDRRQMLEPLVAEHIRQHENNPQQSLATLSSAGQIKAQLQQIGDSELTLSIRALPSQQQATLDPCVTIAMQGAGTSASHGSRFRIVRFHARGGLGEVYVAKDTELGRDVALKEIQLDKSNDVDARIRFTREAEITGGLEHPGIVPVYGLGTHLDGRPFYAMRFIRGNSLQEAIRSYHGHSQPDVPQPDAQARNAASSKPPSELANRAAPSFARAGGDRAGLKSATDKNLELRRLLQRFIDVCEAIDYAHSRGVLHRDLKPGNIMLGRYGETLVVDWGLAKPLGEAAATMPVVDAPATVTTDDEPATPLESPLIPSSHQSFDPTMLGSAIGTPSYMSPEQALGRIDQLGPASDVFSLGATLYSLLTGRPPYVAQNMQELLRRAQQVEFSAPRSLNHSIARPLEAICLQAMAADPAQRYPTAKALAEDIEHYLGDEPVAAMPESPVQRLGRWARRHRQWVQAGAVALVVVAATAVGAYFYQHETSAQNLKLAKDNLKLADDATAKAVLLRASLANYHFSRGISEYEEGRAANGVLDLQRALAMTPNESALKPHYQQVLLDRATRGGRAEFLPAFLLTCPIAISPSADRALITRDGSLLLCDVRIGARIGEPLIVENPVIEAFFSPNGIRLLTRSDDKSAQLWDTRTGAPVGEKLKLAGNYLAMEFSADGDRLLMVSSVERRTKESNQRLRSDVVQLWNANSGTPQGNPIRLEGAIDIAAFNPQGNRVATGGEDDTVRLWDAETGLPQGEPMRHDRGFDRNNPNYGRAVSFVVFSPAGDRLLTGGGNRIQRWDTTTCMKLGQPLVLEDRNNANSEEPDRSGSINRIMQFSPQRDRVLTFNEDDQSARLWDATSGASLCEPLRHGPQSTWVNGYYIAGFNPQGNIVLTMGGDSKARLWDAYTGEDLGILFQGLDIPTKAAFSTQGDRVVTLSPEAARIWEVNSNEPFMKTPPNDIVDAVAFAPGGDYVLTGMRYGGARIWDAKTGALLQTLQHEGSVHVAAFSPQGDRVLIGGASLTRLWNAKTGEPLGEPLPHIGTVSSLGFSPQGDRVITGCSGQYGVTPDEGFARLWDATTGAPLCEPLLHESDVSAVAFNPQGDRVLSMSREGASLWDAKPGVPLGKPLKHKGVVAFAFTPHGYRMVIRNADGSGEVRDSTVDAPTGIALREVKFEQAAFSPQGDRLLTSGNDVRLWDARTGERLGVPIILDTPFLAVAFSPDGDRLLTAGQDYYARLWNVRTGSLLGEPMRHKSAVLAAAFSPRGDCVVTSDFTARLWNARTLTAPQHESNYFELHTGHEVDSDGQSRAVNATEWELKRRDFLRDNEAWMKEQVAHADSRQRQYHQSCLRRALTARDTFVATFHHSWLKKLGLDTSALDEKLEQLRTEQPASKPVW